MSSFSSSTSLGNDSRETASPLESDPLSAERFGQPSKQTLEGMEPRLPLLVTGIAGVPGYNAFHYFRARYPGKVIGLRRKDQWPLSGEAIVGCDLEDHGEIEQLFEEYSFAAVLSCGGSCKLKSCELDPDRARRINVTGIDALLNAIRGTETRLVHTSIDLVYSGEGTGNYLEDHPTDPVTVYGKTMVEAEELIQAEYPNAAILRISLPMGISFNGHAGAIDWIQSRFIKDKPATLYFDEVRTPTYTDCLNRVYERMLIGDDSGLFHAGGTRQLSLYEIAQIVNRIGGYDPNLLHGCPRFDAGPMPPRAGNVTMVSDKLSDLLGGVPFTPWPHLDELVPTHREWHFDRKGDDFGSPEDIARLLYLNPIWEPETD